MFGNSVSTQFDATVGMGRRERRAIERDNRRAGHGPNFQEEYYAQLCPQTIRYTDPKVPGVVQEVRVLRDRPRNRFISPKCNPRTGGHILAPMTLNKGKRSQTASRTPQPSEAGVPLTGKVRLYHFTSVVYLETILREGLSLGDVPVTGGLPHESDHFNNAVWLTTGSAQDTEYMASMLGDPKARFRLTVELDADDPRLWKWSDLARYLGVKPAWYETLNRLGGNQAHNWYVFTNDPIPPSAIVDVTDFG
jgi:hypothetical protein